MMIPFKTLLAAPWTRGLTMLSMLVLLTTARSERANEHLTRCIRMAEPLVQDPQNTFPLVDHEINRVCRMWDGFVACVKDYTKTYLSQSERQRFELAIQSSRESMDMLCDGKPDYRRPYLAYAPCMKRVTTNFDFCGGQYKYLADLVQGTSANDAQLCCAHHKFRDCVLDKTPLECDKDGIASGSSISASRFMRDMLDRALGFLLHKCRDFVPNASNCPRTNFGSPTRTTTHNSNAGDGHNYNSNNNVYNHNDHNHNIGNGLGTNIYFRPDSTTSGPSSTTSQRSTTRFTWTTKGPGSVTPHPASSFNLAGNGFPQPESQQFRGGAAGIIPGITSVVVAVATTTLFRLQ